MRVEVINSAGIFQFSKPNPFFGEDRIEFRDVTLSVTENQLEDIYIYEFRGNPYLQISNSSTQIFNIKIYDLLGKEVLTKTPTTKDLNISQLSSKTVYIIQLENQIGEFKNFKFLKM